MACLIIFKFNSAIESNFTTRRVESKILNKRLFEYIFIFLTTWSRISNIRRKNVCFYRV